MEHAIPINREKLGEHKLGNLVPSCDACNRRKHDMDYKEFLNGNLAAIERIEEYMRSRGYVPLTSDRDVVRILNEAHANVGRVADECVSKINDIIERR
jgi:hypothetical protein